VGFRVTSSSAAATFKAALVTAIKTLVEPEVLVTYGHPGIELADDMIGVTRVAVKQDFATLGTNRTREETLTADVVISCYRGGGPEMEQVVGDRVYDLLGRIEFYVRRTDTTLGGVVRQCFLTSHESEGSTDPDLLAEGRVIECTATFTAQARIT